MSRNDLRRVTVSVMGTNIGVFQTRTGFEADSEDSGTRPEAGADPEPMGGPQSVGEGSVSRTFRPDRDGLIIGWLRSLRGRGMRGARVVINDQPLDEEFAPAGKADVIVGALKSVTLSDHNVNESGEQTMTLGVTGAVIA